MQGEMGMRFSVLDRAAAEWLNKVYHGASFAVGAVKDTTNYRVVASHCPTSPIPLSLQVQGWRHEQYPEHYERINRGDNYWDGTSTGYTYLSREQLSAIGGLWAILADGIVIPYVAGKRNHHRATIHAAPLPN